MILGQKDRQGKSYVSNARHCNFQIYPSCVLMIIMDMDFY